MSIEEVERIMDETKEAVEYQKVEFLNKVHLVQSTHQPLIHSHIQSINLFIHLFNHELIHLFHLSNF